MPDSNGKLRSASVGGRTADRKGASGVDGPPSQSLPRLEALEPRVLFSADALIGLVDVTDENETHATLAGLPQGSQTSVELVFVNSDLDDIDTLLADLTRQQLQGRALAVHLLDSEDSGLPQIEQTLARYHHVSQIHLLAHGNESGLQLGGEWIDLSAANQPLQQLMEWRSHLTSDASVLFYGCDLAASDNGLAFLDAVATATGAQVFASDDTTGHNSRNADWDLEFSSGDGFYDSLLSEVAQASWMGVLESPSLGNGTLASISEDAASIPGDTIANIFSGQFSSPDASSFAGIAIAGDATTSQGAWEYSANGGGSWSELDTVDHDAALLLNTDTMLRFVPAADFNGDTPDLTLYAVDDSYIGQFSSDSASVHLDVNTRGAATAFASAASTIVSAVMAQNDAPTLGDGVLPDIVENAVDPAGRSVAAIFDDQFYDVDAGAVFAGIAIANVEAFVPSKGQWQYSTDAGGNWYSIGAVSASTALMLDSSALLRFVPASNFTGVIPALTVYGVDNTGGPFTSGTSAVSADVGSRGGSTPFALSSAGVSSSVVADFTANDDDLGWVLSGDNLVFSADDLTDNDAVDSDQAPSIRDFSNPALGGLTTSDLNGTYLYSAAAGSSGVASFNYTAMDGYAGLISQWQLTSDGSDDAGLNSGSVMTDDPPGALVFDGDDYVEVPNFSYPDVFTLTFDFRVGDLNNGNEEALFAQGQWQNPNYLGIWINGKDTSAGPGRHLITEIYDSTETESYTPFAYDVSGFEEDGLWHNYAIVVSRDVGHTVYIDGVQVHSDSRADGPFTPNVPVYFGAEDNGGTMDYFLKSHEINHARLYSGFDLPTIQANELNQFDSATASITVRNEETLDNNISLNVDESDTVTISSTQLLTTDIEDTASSLIYEIRADAKYGTLVLGGADLDVGDTFTQQDINDGILEYRHNGSETATADQIALQVDDGLGSVTDFVFAVNLQPVNDAPVLGAIEAGALSYFEGDGGVAVTDTLSVSDNDNQTMQSAFVRFTGGYQQGEDFLDFTDTANLTGFFNSSTGTLTLTAAAGPVVNEDWQAALRSVEYRNNSDLPIVGIRTLSFAVDDGADPSIVVSRTIAVNAVNDAPVMGDAAIESIVEDDTDPSGSTISSLFAGVYSDADGSLSGVAVSGNNATTQGTWQYSTDNDTNWYDIGGVSASAALALDDSTELRFLPAADFFGSAPELILHAIDDSYAGTYTSGATGALVPLTVTGGSSPYAAVASSLAISVSPTGPADLSSGVTINADGGNDTYLLVDNGGALLGGLDQVSVEVQFEIDSANGYNSLFSYNAPIEQLKILIRDNGEIRVGLHGTDIDTDPIPELVNGERHSVAASWSSTDGYLRIFANGKLVKTVAGLHVGQSIAGGGVLIMGLEQDSPGGDFETNEVFSGTLYDIRLWDDVRTPEEIGAHYHQKLYPENLPATLLANWQMDGVNADGKVVDIVSGNNLTVTHTAEPGFTSSVAKTQLQVAEDATPGTVVGKVAGGFPYRGEDLISDGAFTASGVTANTIYSAGSTIGGTDGSWVVSNGDVEIIPTVDTSPSGGPLVDLVGTSQGTISQTLQTEPGKTYLLKFAMSGDFSILDQHSANVTIVSGVASSTYNAIADKPNGWLLGNIIWDQRGFSFIAEGASTTISFAALTNAGNGGVFISDVSLVEVDPSISAVLAANPGVIYNASTHKFYQTDSRQVDWHTAQSNAVTQQLNGVSGRLVTIHSSYENSVVYSLAIAMGRNTYLGGSDQTTEGQWYWQTGTGDGELLWSGNAGGSAPNGVYTNWNGSEPNNNGGSEDHVGLFAVNGHWNDARIDDLWFASIVEWDADDVINKLTYSIESDPQNAFTIDPVTGEISVADLSNIDYATNPSYDITVRVSDVTGEYYDESVSLLVIDNSAPQVTGLETGALDYVENDGEVPITSSLTLWDADDANLRSATISTPTLPGEDVLTFNDYGPFSSSWDPATGQLQITGDAPVADWQTALRQVTYENRSEDPTTGQISIDFEVSDGSESSNIGTRLLNISAVNDAPVLADSTLASISEDDTSSSGQTIGAIFTAQFSDPDGTLAGVAVVQDSTTSEGSWEFSTDAGASWNAIGPVSETNAVILELNARLRFVPASEYYGAVPALNVVAIDNSFDSSVWTTDGTRKFSDVTLRGGSTEYAATTALLDSTVLAVGPTGLTHGIQLNTNGGNDAYLIADNGASLLGGLDALSVETRFSVEEIPIGGDVPLVSYASLANGNSVFFALEEDGTVYLFIDGNRVDAPDDVIVPADGQVRSLAFSWDSTHGEVGIYLDGVLIHYESGIRVGETVSTGGVLVVGQDQDSIDGGYHPQQVLKGTMYDLRVWNEARTAAEIAQTYQHGFHTDDLPATLIANWRMDGVDSNGDVVDTVSGAKLSVKHATGGGFIAGNADHQLTVAEHAANGTVVGTVTPHASRVIDDIVSDGLFNLAGSTGFENFDNGQTLGPGGPWLVGGTNVNLNGGWDSSPLGGTALDLNGVAQGAVSQSLATEVGETYQVTFALTGNFDAPGDKTVSVSAAGTSESYTVSEPDGWINTTNLMWEHRHFEFTATSTNTTLTFASLVASGQHGPVISDVQVVKIPTGVAELLAADASLTYDAATGKFYKPVLDGQPFLTASDLSVSTTLNGVAGQLATIRSAYENELIFSMAQSMGQRVWLGASDSAVEGQWYWLSGDQQNDQFWNGNETGVPANGAYTNWMSGSEPNDSNSSEDVAILRLGDGRWNDVNVADVHSYVIEWNADDVLSSYRYSLTSDAGGAFAINELTGEITVADGSKLDYESSGLHHLVVRVADVTGETHEETVAVLVSDVAAPAISGIEATTYDYYEDDGPAIITSSLTVSDTDDTTLESASVTIRSAAYTVGEHELLFTDYGAFTSTWTPSTGQLTIDGVASVADWQAALRTVSYNNTSDDPQTGAVFFDFLIFDGKESSAIASRQFDIHAVNDAPELTDSTLASVTEDDLSPEGQTVSEIFSPQFSDIDGTFGGVAVINDTTLSEGTWEYRVDGGGAWFPIGSVAPHSALVLSPTMQLRFVPAADFYGAVPQLDVVGLDNSFVAAFSSATATYTDASVRGSTTPYAAADSALLSTVLAVGPTDLSSGTVLNTDGGNDAYLVAANGDSIVGGLTALTIEVNASFASLQGQSALVSYAVPGTQDALVLRVQSDGSIFAVINNTQVHAPDLPYITADDRAYAIALSWDNIAGRVSLYVDGQLVHTTTGVETGGAIPGGGTLVFGQDQDSPGGDFESYQAFEGALHDIRIWNTARTDAEISLSHAYKLHTDSLPDALIANWQMDQFDSSGALIDVVNSRQLNVGHVVASGFTTSVVQNKMSVEEYAPNGSVVGTLVPTSGGWATDLVSDGLFSHVSNTVDALHTTGSSIGPGSAWTVDSGDIHTQGSWDSTPLGGVALDVSGTEPGKISQTLVTEPGQTYQLSFAYSGNFNVTTDKTVLVTAGADSASFTVSAPDGWDKDTALMWSHRTFTFTATSASTTLSFEATAPNDRYGPLIGDIQVVELPVAVQQVLASDASLSYNASTGKFYKPVNTVNTFTDARDSAIAQQLNGVSGQLVTIESAFENDVVQSLAQAAGGRVWLGASDSVSEGHWFWLDGRQQGDQFWDGDALGTRVDGAYNNWDGAEPNNSHTTGEHHAALSHVTGGWNDVYESTTYRSIVEWEADAVLSNFTFELLSDPSGAFTVDEDTGIVSVFDGTKLDFESANSHDINVRVTDANGDMHDDTITIGVTNVTAPLIVGVGGDALIYTENATPLLIGTTLDVSDNDDTHLQSATVVISSGYQAAEDLLTFADTATLISSWDVATGTLTISGFDTVSAWTDAIRAVQYQNTSDDPTSGFRTVEFSVADANESSNKIALSVSVVAVNDSPSMLDTQLSTVTEDSTSHAGDTVANLLTTAASDIDGNVVAIAIAGNAEAGEGQWQYSTDNGGDWYSPGAVSEMNAVVLDVNARLRFLPAMDYNGPVPALTVYAIDDSASMAGSMGIIKAITDVTVRGGNTQFSANSAVIDGQVSGVNDTPTLALNPVTLLRGGIYTFNATDIQAMDVDVDKTQRVITVTSAPIYGGLHLAGVPLNVGDTFSQAQVDAGDLSYVNNGLGSDNDNFALRINDAGDSPSSLSADGVLSVTVDETHPQGEADHASVDEHLSVVIRVLDNDSIGDESLDATSVTIVSAATNGSTTVDAAGEISYTHDGSETTDDAFSYTVSDTGGDVSDPVAVTITVTPVNDNPVLSAFAGPPSHTSEDTQVEITAAELAAQIAHSDAEDTSLSTFVVTSVSSGNLLIGGSAASATPFVAGSNDAISSGLHAYWTPSADENGLLSAFSVKGVDSDGAESVGSVTVDVNVIASNDNPVISGQPVAHIDYLHRSPAVPLVTSANVTDIDSTQLASMTAQVRGYEPGVDLLSINAGSLSGSWNSATGELTVTGSGSLSEYQDVLRTLAYESDAVPGGGSVTTRTIDVTVTDSAGGVSNAAAVNVNLQVPAFPIIATDSASGSKAYIENAVGLSFADALEVDSVDGRNITNATLQINQFTASDLLSFTDTADITGAWDASNATLNLSGDATDVVWQSALRSVTYMTTSDNPDTTTREIVITLESSSGLSDPLVVPVQVVAVNDAPFGRDSSIEFAANSDYTFTRADFGFSDPLDNHGFSHVRIERLPDTGRLLLSESVADIGDEVAVSDIDAGALRFVPQPSTQTTADSLEFNVRDTGGNTNGGSDLSANTSVLTMSILPGEIPVVDIDDVLPFEVDENAPDGAVIGNLAALSQSEVFVRQQGGDFADAYQGAAGYTRYAADGSNQGASIDEWQVTLGNVDLRGSAWATGPDGGIALDLNGSMPGQISQQIPTVPGAQYVVSYQLSGNFLQRQPDQKVHVEVEAAGDSESAEFSHFTDWSRTNLQWREQALTFTAVDTTTDIRFTSLTAGAYGPLIADINVTDVLTYRVANSAAPFSVSGEELVVDGLLDYETTPSYRIDVIASNMAGVEEVMSIPIDVLDRNESPQVIRNQQLAIIVGQSAAVRSDYLQSIDVDQADQSADARRYTVNSLPVWGELLLSGAPLTSGDSFSQSDVDQGRLSYQHNGPEAATDMVKLAVSDGGEDGAAPVDIELTVVIHDPLNMSVAPLWDMLEGGVMTLNDTHISRSAGLIDNNDIAFNVIEMSSFFSLQETQTGTQVDTFNWQQLVDGEIRLSHDGSEQHEGELQMQLSRTDSGVSVTMDTVTVQLVADDVADSPAGSNSSLTTDHKTPLVISLQQLGFNDNDDADNLAGILIDEVPATGRLMSGDTIVASGDIIGPSVIGADRLRYIPDPLTVGELRETITFHIVDTGDLANGGSNTSEVPYHIAITINSDHEPQGQSDRIVVAEGGTISSLASGEPSVRDNDTDLDTATTDLLIELATQPAHGTLQLNQDGTFVYVHDGSETISDSFSYRVVDSDSELGQLLGNVGMVEIEIIPTNDPPQAGEARNQQFIANELVEIDLPEDLFTDIDSNDQLTMTASLTDGSPLPAWLEFNEEAGEFSGIPDNNQAGTLQIMVTATDSAGATAQSEFEIEVEPQIGTAFSQAVSPDSAVQESLPPTTAVSQQPAAATAPEPLASTPEPEAEEKSAPTDQRVTEESGTFFENTASRAREVTIDFQDTVVKHERVQKVTTIDVGVIEHAQIRQAQVLGLQQLFFIADHNPLKLTKEIQQELNRVNGELTHSGLQHNFVMSGTISLSAGFSIGYVIWLVRGGLLLSSVLASMPAWKVIDPVPVLEEATANSDKDNESLESIANSDKTQGDESPSKKPQESDHGAESDGQKPDSN